MGWLKQHFFSYILFTLLVLTIGASYMRFMVLKDYLVAYEGECDPYVESCFIGCEDDTCTEEYFYFKIQKYAKNVEMQCGNDISECEDAFQCLPEEGDMCQITYCDPAIEGADSCETLTENDIELEISEPINAEEVSIPESIPEETILENLLITDVIEAEL